MRAFINRDDIDFGMAAQLAPVQEWSLVEDATASLEFATKLSKFQAVSSLTLFFPSNGGAPCTRIHFVGLRGEVRLRSTAHLAELPGRHVLTIALAGERPEARGSAEHSVRGEAATTRPQSGRRDHGSTYAAIANGPPAAADNT